MKYNILIIWLTFSVSLFGQALTKKEMKYKPKSLKESVVQLEKLTPDSTEKKIKEMTEKEFLSLTHFTTGMWIRNEWLYNRYLFGIVVTKSELRKELSSKGLYDNDDMSSVILRSYYRQANGMEIQLDQQIKDIHQWYVNMNNSEWRAKQDSISLANYMAKYAIGDTLTRNVYFDRNWLGKPRKNAEILAKVIEKSDKQLKIEIFSFGGESDKNGIYEEIECNSGDCWINPNWWKKKNGDDKLK